VQPAYDDVLVGHLDGRGNPDRHSAGVLLHGQAPGGPEEAGVVVGTAAVGAPFGDRVQHLDTGLVGGCDQPTDVLEGAGSARLVGEFGQCAVGAHDSLLALDRQESGGGRIELLGELFPGRHGCPSRWLLVSVGGLSADSRAREANGHCAGREEDP
jgi:hypothetical protein